MQLASPNFFSELFEASVHFVYRTSLPIEPVPISQITSILEPALLNRKHIPAEISAEFATEMMLRSAKKVPAGLNTIGMLLDRFSILAIKIWNLEVRRLDKTSATSLRTGEVNDIIAALHLAQRGYSSLNTKITSHHVDLKTVDFSGAYSTLLSANLLLWEAQEILYNRDILKLPAEELRAYIVFFSEKNLLRNAYIEQADKNFWKEVQTVMGG